MPYIHVATNTQIPADARETVKARLGQDATILGKSESWLMVGFTENQPLYFKGTPDPAAIVSVDLYGDAGADAYQRMTAAVTKLLGDTLGIPAARIFVKYQPYEHWGWNGNNF